MSDIATYKPSFSFSDILSEELRADSEQFLLFLQAYYEWMQTASITITNKTGTFQRDENVIQTKSVTVANGDIFDVSVATGVIKQVDVANNILVVKMTTNRPFDLRTLIEGETSGATATTTAITDNVLRHAGRLGDNRTIENSVDKYVEFLKDELYSTMPMDMEVDERFIAKKFKEFFRTKGNEESYKFLFRVLYGENIELKYPGEEILRVSDGKFEKARIIRVLSIDNTTDYLNQTVAGETSGALGNVVDIRKFFIGPTEISQLTLTLTSGTFLPDEKIYVVADETVNTTAYGMLTGFEIVDGGSGYGIGDNIAIESSVGTSANASVLSIKSSPITKITIDVPGYGYREGVNAIINNTGTGGTGFAARVTSIANSYVTNGYTVGETATVSIINRGSDYFKAPTITLEDTTISALGLLSNKLITIQNAGTGYAVGDALVFTGGSGANAAGNVAAVVESTSYNLLFEDDFRMISENSYDDIIKNEDWSVEGPIARVELTNFGTGYTLSGLPTITVTSSNGVSANLVSTGIQGKGATISVDVANNATGIGSIRAISIDGFGINYITGDFLFEDGDKLLLENGTERLIYEFATTANTTSVGDGNAFLRPIITGLAIDDGNWTNDDGKIDYKILQDSDYYQDFSYVIRCGLVFDQYADVVRKVIHPAGLQFFGEILIQLFIDVSPQVLSSTTEVFANVNEYIVYLEGFYDASVQTVGEIEVQSSFEMSIDISTDFNLEAERKIILSLLGDEQIVIEGLNQYNPIITLTANTETSYEALEIQKEIESLVNSNSITVSTSKEIEIELTDDVSVSRHIEIVEQINLTQDVSAADDSEKIVVLPKSANVSTNLIDPIKEIEIELTDDVSVSRHIEIVEQINLTQDVSAADDSEKIVVLPKSANVSTNLIDPILNTLGDVQILVFANDPISLLQNDTFEDEFLATVTKFNKITGTVSVSGNVVIGTGTTFDTELIPSVPFIVLPEKFIISSIANSTHMTLNVPAENVYNNVSAYKETYYF